MPPPRRSSCTDRPLSFDIDSPAINLWNLAAGAFLSIPLMEIGLSILTQRPRRTLSKKSSTRRRGAAEEFTCGGKGKTASRGAAGWVRAYQNQFENDGRAEPAITPPLRPLRDCLSLRGSA